MSEICYEPSQIFQPSGARAAPSRLGPPIRPLRSCPVFDALGVRREALRLGVGWLWCGGLHGSRCRRCRACCGFGPWQSGDAPVDYVDDSHVHVAAAGRVVDRDDAVQTIRERLPSFVVVRAAARFFHYRSGLHEPFGAGVALLFGLFGPDHALVLPDALDLVLVVLDLLREALRHLVSSNRFKRGRLLRNAEQVAGEQSEKLRGAVPWLEDTDIPSDWDQANRFRMRATKAIHDHDMQPRTGLVDELERRLEQAERAEGEKPSPEQVKALALRMAEQRERAAEDPTQDMNRPEPSGDEPLDLSEPEDLGESGPFEERSAPRTKADLLREIRQRADRLTGQREAEQRQIDPWRAQPPQRRGHGR